MRGMFERWGRLVASWTANDVKTVVEPQITRVDSQILAVAARLTALQSEVGRLDERVNQALAGIDALSRQTGETLAVSRGVSAQVAGVTPTLERVRREVEFVRHYRSNYLGDGVSIAWLPDDTIMFLNANDDGGPSALVSGGRYEESNFDVFFSFLTESSLVLDIGANLGVYALRTAQRFRNSNGRVIAFEPHPLVATLFRRSIEHNGLKGQIEVRQTALAERSGDATFHYPPAHLGQGGNPAPTEGWVPLPVRLEVADELFPEAVVDLVKLDVEGNELSVLKGMRALIARSPAIAILFEKLYASGAEAAEQFDLLTGLGLTVYAIEGDARLRPLDFDAYLGFEGYLLAARASLVGDALDRRFFHISWRQLSFTTPPQPQVHGGVLASAPPNEALFYGPYWRLPKGRYRLTLEGRLEGPMTITIAEQFGVEVRKFAVDPVSLSAVFEIPYDLRKFECVARAGDRPARLVLNALRFQRF